MLFRDTDMLTHCKCDSQFCYKGLLYCHSIIVYPELEGTNKNSTPIPVQDSF